MEQQYRYPGVHPFTQSEQDLFFGREDDSKELFKYINLENLVVLYGKSGLGKSSLLNASVVPELQRERNYHPLMIRFNNYDEELDLTPVTIFNNIIQSLSSEESYIDQIPVAEVSLWQSLKKLQLTRDAYSEGKFILVFDQFEELFTYPEGIEKFALQLSDLLNRRIPSEFRKNLRRALTVDTDLQEKITPEEKERLLAPLDVKVLISIRSDRLSQLNSLKDYIPEILMHSYELQPLNEEQARNCIVKPAELDGNFISPKFYYADETLDHILSFLQKDSAKTKKRKAPIESFQLQIICQYIESKVINGDISAYDDRLVVQKSDLDINLDTILQQYYDQEISKLPHNEQPVARRLIEDGLILADEQRRTSLDIGILKKRFPDVTSNLLNKLVETRIVRAEPNSFGGVSYELSHDTLIEPILRRRREREEQKRIQEEKEKREQEVQEQLAKEKQKQKKIRRRIITGAVIFIIVLLSAGVFRLNSAYKRETQARKELAKANAKIKKYSRTRVGALQMENQNLKKIIERDSALIHELKETNNTLKNEYIPQKDSKIYALSQELEDKNTRIDSLKTHIQQQTDKIAQLRDTIQREKSRKNEALAKIKNYESEIKDHKADKNALKKKNSALNERLQKTSKQLSDVKSQRSSLKKQLSEVKSQRSSLKEQLSEVRSQRSSLKTELNEMKEENKTLKEEVESYQERSQNLQQKINNLQQLRKNTKEGDNSE